MNTRSDDASSYKNENGTTENIDVSINFETLRTFKDCEVFLEETKNVSILHANVRSMEKNFENLLVLLKAVHRNPDLIVCSEVWALKTNKLSNLSVY